MHAELKGRHGRAMDDRHLAGVVGTKPPIRIVHIPEAASSGVAPSLLRPLSEYEAVLGGRF
jgi:hypothetical protein